MPKQTETQRKKAVDYIVIHGRKYPIHFGLKTINEFTKETGHDFEQIVALGKPELSVEAFVTIARLGLKDGARRAGSSEVEPFDEDELWDAFDEEPSLIFDLADLFSDAIHPIVTKLNGLIDEDNGEASDPNPSSGSR